MDEKIYQELVLIRRELQTIRKGMEFRNVTLSFSNGSEGFSADLIAERLAENLKTAIDNVPDSIY